MSKSVNREKKREKKGWEMAGRAGRVVKKKGSNLLWVTIILSFQGKKKKGT